DGQGGRVKISPLARRIAEDRGVDVSSIKGSGPGGRIVQADVLAAAEGGARAERAPEKSGKDAAADAVAPSPMRMGSGDTQVIELTKMRQTIATRLQQSKQQLPHFYE